jgi:hypothetical protein
LFIDIFKPANKISIFNSSANNLTTIEPKLIKRLQKAEIIDLTANTCIDVVYNKSSTAVPIDTMFSKVFMYCSEDY